MLLLYLPASQAFSKFIHVWRVKWAVRGRTILAARDGDVVAGAHASALNNRVSSCEQLPVVFVWFELVCVRPPPTGRESRKCRRFAALRTAVTTI